MNTKILICLLLQYSILHAAGDSMLNTGRIKNLMKKYNIDSLDILKNSKNPIFLLRNDPEPEIEEPQPTVYDHPESPSDQVGKLCSTLAILSGNKDIKLEPINPQVKLLVDEAFEPGTDVISYSIKGSSTETNISGTFIIDRNNRILKLDDDHNRWIRHTFEPYLKLEKISLESARELEKKMKLFRGILKDDDLKMVHVIPGMISGTALAILLDGESIMQKTLKLITEKGPKRIHDSEVSGEEDHTMEEPIIPSPLEGQIEVEKEAGEIKAVNEEAQKKEAEVKSESSESIEPNGNIQTPKEPSDNSKKPVNDVNPENKGNTENIQTADKENNSSISNVINENSQPNDINKQNPPKNNEIQTPVITTPQNKDNSDAKAENVDPVQNQTQQQQAQQSDTQTSVDEPKKPSITMEEVRTKNNTGLILGGSALLILGLGCAVYFIHARNAPASVDL